jgi:phosphohistidine phosphatase
LKKRGRNDVVMMAGRLAARGFAPQCLFSSMALRALRTAEDIAAAIDLPPHRLKVDPLIYGTDTRQLIQFIHNLDEAYDWGAIVGHNPEMTSLICQLSGQFIDHVPTCGVAQLHFKIDRWPQMGNGDAKPCSFDFDYPKNVRP